jgi:small subunit ribosomal protein S1
VQETTANGAIVTLAEDVEAFVPGRHMDREEGGKIVKGDTVNFKVLEFNKEYRRLVISHSAIFRAEEQKNIKTAAKKSNEAEKTTLGDTNDALQALKDKMESGK